MARLRVEDLLKEAHNLSNLLAEIKAGQIGTPAPQNRVNDLNNNLFDLWLKIAGYGLGTDPYLDNIFASPSAFSRAHLAPDYGVSDVPQTMGIPRLYERFLNSGGQNPSSRETKLRGLSVAVLDYGNPAIYPHKLFYERAYSRYRNGQDIESQEFKDDLDHIEVWLRTLIENLGKVKSLLASQ